MHSIIFTFYSTTSCMWSAPFSLKENNCSVRRGERGVLNCSCINYVNWINDKELHRMTKNAHTLPSAADVGTALLQIKHWITQTGRRGGAEAYCCFHMSFKGDWGDHEYVDRLRLGWNHGEETSTPLLIKVLMKLGLVFLEHKWMIIDFFSFFFFL